MASPPFNPRPTHLVEGDHELEDLQQQHGRACYVYDLNRLEILSPSVHGERRARARFAAQGLKAKMDNLSEQIQVLLAVRKQKALVDRAEAIHKLGLEIS